MHGTGSFTGPWLSARATTRPGGVKGTYAITTVPAVVQASTLGVRITGTLRNFGGISGCDVGFRGTYRRRPN
jgi:hypothetical protein